MSNLTTRRQHVRLRVASYALAYYLCNFAHVGLNQLQESYADFHQALALDPSLDNSLDQDATD